MATKRDIIQRMQALTGASRDECSLVLEEIVNEVRQQVLINGNELNLRGFGVFHHNECAPRRGRDLNNDTETMIKARSKVTFSASTLFQRKAKEAIQHGAS